ncbi:phosphate ABC transporter ATP-binding protein [Candidatus Bathyarchaeota archaeon]|nr:MAG: phosphate ABC transporter ATP-binding protein [Candidatus Bathyarchaeota archaeon]
MEKLSLHPSTLTWEETIVKTENLNVYYGNVHALKNVNVKIPKNQVTAIMGPSGCGKTTLLKCFNRLIELTNGVKITGKIYINGVNIYDKNLDVNSLRRKVGMVFQKPNPLPMSIYDNVAYGLKIYGLKDKKKLDMAVKQALKTVGLWEEIKNRLKDSALKLSGGQQQRLCIARALAVEPEILLMDEPTSSLDPISAKHIENLILTLKNNYTVIIVTHNVHQALRIAEYVIFLYMGSVIESGPAKEIFQKPKHPETQAYLRGEFS